MGEKMMKIASIIGARPQFIKLSPLSKELRKYHKEIIIHTGQHYDRKMSGLFFKELDITEPDYNLEVGSGSHGYQTGEMLKRIEKVLIKEKPDLVIVYGDTNSTLAGALAAAKLNIKVVHIEAGLREFDKSIPEEINKIVSDHTSEILFCPSDLGVRNLAKEGITANVYNVGDITLDLAKRLLADIILEKSILKKYNLKKKDFCYMTMHREKNTKQKKRLGSIVSALEHISKTIIFPVHPRTIKALKEYKLWGKINQIKSLKIVPPIGYNESIMLIKNAEKTITDSGGVIKESYFLKTPAVIIDDTTEWVETIEDGWNIIAGADKNKIIRYVNKTVKPRRHREVYGNGKSAQKIIKILNNHLSESQG
tara:strand:+ start:276 stop:1376 length:1101 start_codon:yes stop_codon:yes gene_type:complete